MCIPGLKQGGSIPEASLGLWKPWARDTWPPAHSRSSQGRIQSQRSREERGRSPAERCGLEGPESLGPISSVTGAGTNAFHTPHRVAWVSAITLLPAPRWITDISVTLGGSCQTSEPLPGELA